ncbi:L-threonylcarbamoyladenylate synthase [Wenxinia saemankumensis]|uniref:Threonylcarbamoyl-AMP synthase n=1 Tax=Wenxinia saemankumensis TaxID=1447782 RepID=A0A1M6E8R9_9RHOB|nr:L-threonylcarbamoyladenylate synthase [Wenxinia saemankumensis]SHI81759.1 translation factor SUA5 [Wenxinia saemankumensis]
MPDADRETVLLAADAAGLARAAALIRDGGRVAFPTETVYGLGADAGNGDAVAGIYAAKGRPSFNPLIVHVADLAAARRLCEVPRAAEEVAAAFWPGPLTLVLPLRGGAPVSRLVTAGLDTLAIRVPAHPLAQALLRAAGVPVAAPSANPSGRISPTRAAHVMDGLGGRIDAVLDGGPCGVGVESTILSLAGDRPRLLREGGLPAEALEAMLGPLDRTPDAGSAPSAPGQLVSHYAPRGRVRLGVTAPEPGETLLGFGSAAGAAINLSEAGDLHEAAARLFDALHALDAMGAERIAVSPIPETGLGRAINDRLRRAAAPRD